MYNICNWKQHQRQYLQNEYAGLHEEGDDDDDSEHQSNGGATIASFDEKQAHTSCV